MKSTTAMTKADARGQSSYKQVRLNVDVQQALDEDCSDAEEPPSAELITTWARLAYSALEDDLHAELTEEAVREPAEPNGLKEVTIRLVGRSEMTALNRDFRQLDKPTNVLSFAYDPPEFELADSPDVVLFGDIIVCHPVIISEAGEQQKTIHDHYAHMVMHGILHLGGYDHQDEQSAEQMESLEIKILANVGIANPYNREKA